MELLQVFIFAILLITAFIGGYITALQDKAELKQSNDNNFNFITLKKPSSDR